MVNKFTVNKKKNLQNCLNRLNDSVNVLRVRVRDLHFRSRDIRGASIVIALSMIAAIMFFTIGMASTMIMAIQNTSDSKKAVQAEYAAQAGVEMVNLFFKNIEPATDLTDGITSPVSLYSDVNVALEAYGRDTAPETVYSLNYRSVPLKGYGNASSSCQNLDNANAPCNWNKLFYGDSVEIPLYYIHGENITNFKDLGITNFSLRIRTPCIESPQIDNCNRYPIDSSQTDVVINWQFSGESCLDTSCVVNATSDSQITGFDIADAGNNNNNKVLEETSLCQDSVDPENYQGTVYNFLKNSENWNGNSLVKPKFKFSYVQALEGANNTSIPYLEYQFIYTPAGSSLAAMYRTKITGNANGVQYQLNGVQSLGAGLFDFAVQN